MDVDTKVVLSFLGEKARDNVLSWLEAPRAFDLYWPLTESSTVSSHHRASLSLPR